MGAAPYWLQIQNVRPNAVEMTAEAKEFHADLVVVDTLAELWRGHIRSAKDSDEVSAFIHPFIRELRDAGVALVFSHHTPKSGNDYAGAQALGAKVDVLANMRRPGKGTTHDQIDEREDDPEIDDGRRLLEVRGRGVRHAVQRLSFDGENYCIGDAALPLAERILRAIPVMGASGNAIAKVVGTRKKTVSDTLKDLKDAGRVRYDGVHWFVCPPVVPQGGPEGDGEKVAEPPLELPVENVGTTGNSAGTRKELPGIEAGTGVVPTEIPKQSLREPPGAYGTLDAEMAV
jgi:hypothetical protein